MAKGPAPGERPDGGDRAVTGDRPAYSQRQTPVAASSMPSPSVPRIETFKIIYERNMFNAHRIGFTPRISREGREANGDMVVLVGTLIEQKKALAFFDSADPRFRRVMKEGTRLPSGHILKTVEADGVILFKDNASAKVQVTQRLHRMDNGEWEILQPETGSAMPSGTAAPVDPSKPAAMGAMPVIPPNASDALRRLMEQRQKQLKE